MKPELPSAAPLFTKAYEFAQKAHEGQVRAEGTPYITHCAAVEKIISEEWGIRSPELRAAALLHDTVEDNKSLTFIDIENEFGSKVAFLVEGVSQLRSEKENGVSKIEKDRETVRKVFNKNLIDPNVGVLKLADRLHNMRTLMHMPPEKQIAKAKETEGYAKLAESLGMWVVMRELEDLSLKYSSSRDYEKYARIRNEDPRTGEQFVEWLKSTLTTIATDAAIDAHLETRKISLPVLKNKKGKYLTEKINDLISFRVIVKGSGEAETRNQVYKMLGIIRENFAGIEDLDRFDDFYSKPRDNNYSAIQLTLDFPEGSTEIAISCEEKEEFNNWGIVSLIRRGETDLQKHALKLIFTPTHEVKFFQAKATGLDFAYSISPSMGARAEYAVVNGEVRPISTVLPNGAEVEIEIGEPRIAPKKELINFCLPNTRRVIDEQLSEQAKWEFEMKGKEAIYGIICKRGLIDLTDLLKIDKHKANLENLLYVLGCKGSIEDLYYKVGSGVMDIKDLEKHFDEAEITKSHLCISSILIEGVDGPGIWTLVSSAVSALGGNIGPMENRPHISAEGTTFTLRMVVENLSGESELKLAEAFGSDPRITKVIVV